MEKQWFVESKPRHSRTLLTVVGSVVLHGAIIAVAALWPVRPAAPAALPPPMDPGLTGVPEVDVPVKLVQLPSSPTETNLTPPTEPEPASPTAEASNDVPPTTEDMTLVEPAPARSTPKTAVGKTRPLHAAPVGAAHGQPGAVNATPGIVGAVGRWHTPQPPYPYTMRAAHVQGSGSVRITTDASGRVVAASVVQSTGNPVLDGNTSQFARTTWSGPPNASTTVPITYQLH